MSYVDKLMIYWTNGTPFQFLGLIALMASMCSHIPIVTGLAFLEKEPPEFECLEAGVWVTCTKTEICRDGLP